ncbi:MAG TPA: SDR family oxidoreductase [Acidimicrobiia bacterium]|nr:SDR family oxidoreductase [Acidimicrobiia bacterium]
MLTDLTGHVSIVTGAAAGLGRASALALAQCGSSVVVADKNLAGAQDAVAEIADAGGAALAVEVDVAQDEPVRDMVRRTVERFGGLDLLMNNAAELTPEVAAGDGNVVSTDLAVWNRVLAVNLTGTMLGCRYAVPEMVRRGKGSIINMSSVSSMLADVDHCAYGASKAGINNLTKSVAAAFGKQGIRCNAIAAGVVVNDQIRARHGRSSLDELESHHLTPRLGVPGDIAQAVVFLASDDSLFWTGQVLLIDGGFSCHMPHYAARMRSVTDGA